MKFGDVNLRRPANDGGEFPSPYFPKVFLVLLFHFDSQTTSRALYRGVSVVVRTNVGFANHLSFLRGKGATGNSIII